MKTARMFTDVRSDCSFLPTARCSSPTTDAASSGAWRRRSNAPDVCSVFAARGTLQMAKKENAKKNPITRAASSVRRAISRITHHAPVEPEPVEPREFHREPAPPLHARPKRAESDIPREQLDRSYTPPQTSLKAPFRRNGADRQRDQEFASGAGDERWNDEDRFTN